MHFIFPSKDNRGLVYFLEVLFAPVLYFLSDFNPDLEEHRLCKFIEHHFHYVKPRSMLQFEGKLKSVQHSQEIFPCFLGCVHCDVVKYNPYRLTS